ncbi:MAG: sigma-54 dependent transcriptional regulator [Pseudomonadota bacterium]
MSLGFRDAVLLVEDTPSLSMMYKAALERAGLTVTAVDGARAAMKAYRTESNPVVLLDLMLPDGNGLDVLAEIRAINPKTRVVVITADGSINRAVEAMRGGAFDFLVKPFDDRRLLGAVENAIAALDMDQAGASDGAPGPDTSGELSGFVGSSEPMRAIYAMIRNIGRSTATVFITGESGTGKEIAAQAIHDQSTRRNGPFIAINCGAIPKDLLESEVFGHLKGSFTGAISDKIGAAAAADGGTLFLDEVCEMDLALQTKLLRFLQTSMIQPVGAVEPRKVDVRIVCATNREPAVEVAEGRFREDLFYRLHVVPIVMPPLRLRGNDVLEIGESLLEKFSGEEGKTFTAFAHDVRERLLSYEWPGNVRQLQNVVRHAVVLFDGTEVTLEMLPEALQSHVQPGLNSFPSSGSVTELRTINRGQDIRSLPGQNLNGQYVNGHTAEIDSEVVLRNMVGTTLADMEREFIEITIQECNGSIPRAARLLDVSPSTLYRKREAWDRSAS